MHNLRAEVPCNPTHARILLPEPIGRVCAHVHVYVQPQCAPMTIAGFWDHVGSDVFAEYVQSVSIDDALLSLVGGIAVVDMSAVLYSVQARSLSIARKTQGYKRRYVLCGVGLCVTVLLLCAF